MREKEKGERGVGEEEKARREREGEKWERERAR